MEKLSLDKFVNEQIESNQIAGGKGGPAYEEPAWVAGLSASETVYGDDHTTGTGEGGCGIEHESGCHHHYADEADGSALEYVGCGASANLCNLGIH